MIQSQAKIPNIVILCMTYNDDSIKENETAIKSTWALKLMDNVIPNIKFFFYTSGKRNSLNEKTHRITVTSGDDVNSTFDKTVKAIQLLNKKNIEYDYIVRVNLSTYINITFLNNYIYMSHQCYYKDLVHCSTIVKGENDTYFPCGKIIIFNKQHINDIINYTGDTNKADDVVYGDIFGLKNEKDIVKVYKTISTPIYYNWTDNFYYSCSDYSTDVLKKYIYMSVRDINDNRKNEVDSMYKIYNSLLSYKTDYNDFLNIFIGTNTIVDDSGIIVTLVKKA